VLLRREADEVLAIGQPAHAWVSGQLARAWGNGRFGAVEPREEVCLAAEQHDVGMTSWELAPTVNPQTGLPHSFLELPIASHLEMWRCGPRRLLPQSHYASLLVSMHGHRLYERRDLSRLSAGDAANVRAFLAEQVSYQQRLLRLLRADPVTAPVAGDALVRRNSELVWTWDHMSLALCLDWPPDTVEKVPTAHGPAELRMTPGEKQHDVIVDPWPFTDPDGVTVRCEGRRLQSGAPLDDARWETLQFRLVPAH
jgi:hypothetical protein